MNETDIRRYAGLMEELGLTGLEITEDNKVVRLERMAPAPARETTETVAPVYAPEAVSPKMVPPKTAPLMDCSSVKSPLVGIFYAAPAENAAPYVSIGDHVKKGQVLCLVEAMKLMNEVVAEEDGIVSMVCATNGQVVEYGTELFRLTKPGMPL